MTVKELIEELSKMPKKANVYMVTDRSYRNYDEDGRYIAAHKIEFVTKEELFTEEGEEVNVLLEIPEK